MASRAAPVGGHLPVLRGTALARVDAVGTPAVGPGVFVHRTYWELILPRDEHLLVPPAEFTAEYHWDWNGLLWARKPILEQAHLENMVRGPAPGRVCPGNQPLSVQRAGDDGPVRAAHGEPVHARARGFRAAVGGRAGA